METNHHSIWKLTWDIREKQNVIYKILSYSPLVKKRNGIFRVPAKRRQQMMIQKLISTRHRGLIYYHGQHGPFPSLCFNNNILMPTKS
jgi:hypothetical protein